MILLNKKISHKTLILFFFAFLASVALVAASIAETRAEGAALGKSGLPLPRYVSLAKSEVNLRKGPGLRYPIAWIYKRSGLPVEIINEFDNWRQIRDWEGTIGWVHRSMLKGKRSIIIKDEVRTLRQDPGEGAPALLRAEAGVIGRLLECAEAWCRIEVAGRRGWLKTGEIFGVYPDEVVK